MNPYPHICIMVKSYQYDYRKFLCGFRKRKIVRQQKAQGELQQRLVTEKNKIKNNVSFYILY